MRFLRADSQSVLGRSGRHKQYAVCGNANCYAPPALRPGCQVPGLSAIDGAGNACILPFARSAAWTESWRSLAEASAAAERRKASGPLPTLPRRRGRKETKRPAAAQRISLRSLRTLVCACADRMVRLSALRSLRIFFLVVVRHASGADASRERICFHLSPHAGRGSALRRRDKVSANCSTLGCSQRRERTQGRKNADGFKFPIQAAPARTRLQTHRRSIRRPGACWDRLDRA